jgi:glycosyltransferase involved in cell wall biosynthesis
MRKFLFIAANEGASWGGSEPLWSSAAEKLARAGNEVRVSVKDWDQPVPQIEQLRKAGCQIFYRRPPSFLSRQLRKILPLTEHSRAHIRSVGVGVDLIVISQGYNADGLPWMEEARAAGLKYAPIAHSAVVYWWPVDGTAEKLAAAYENASAAYFVSEANLKLSRLQFATPLRNGKVVRNPFNVPYDAHPPWPGDASEELALACVGRLDVISKAQDVLLEVLSLPHWRARKVRLSLIGAGPHERGLRRIVEQLQLTSVAFPGYQNNIEQVWSQHHALVAPSRFEGMPLAVVEAMLCGRPCIVTDVGGNGELIRDGQNGFMAEAPTVPFVGAAMNRAWEERQGLQKMGETAARDVRKWVSADPAEDFARELMALVEGPATK